MRFPGAALLPALMGLLLWGCAPNVPRTPENGRADTAKEPPPHFLLIYLIHGDGDYGWHDARGIRHMADTEAEAQALEVAQGSPRAEVFVFHQKRKRFLGLWRTTDGRMIHYRGGIRLEEAAYRRSGPGLAAEASLLRTHAARPPPAACTGGEPAASPRMIFGYFGHGLAPGEAARFLSDLSPACPAHKPFSLVMLSACHGGTPAMAYALAPFAGKLLASPGDLHLAYLDTRPLSRLDPADTAIGDSIAAASFARLRPLTQTAITLAVYDLEKSPWYPAPHSGWGAAADRSSSWRDCADLPGFAVGGEPFGVRLLYRPSRFGTGRNKLTHSGWECPTID
jgi:hypothetical protein